MKHIAVVQAILNSIAIHPDVRVKVPRIIPGNPPKGIDAPCLDQYTGLGWAQIDMPQISKQEASGMDQTVITGALFSQYLEEFLEPTVPDPCHLTSFSIAEVSIASMLDYLAQE